MNPFLHDTVAQPLGAEPVRKCKRPYGASLPALVSRTGSNDWRVRQRCSPGLQLLDVHRLGRVLRVASLAALTWAGTAGAVDLNTATLDQLQGIRGIGMKTAQIILDERSRGGRYLSFSDLSDRVRGIGPRRAQALQSAGLTIDGGGTRLSGQGAQAQQAASAAAVRAPALTDSGKQSRSKP